MSAKAGFFSNWRNHQGGAVAIYVAITFPVFLAVLGFGLDYWTTLSVKARLNASADAGAVAAVRAATAYMQANGAVMSGSQLSNAAISAGKAAATQAFNANAGPTLQLNPLTPSVTVTYANRAFTSTVSYSTKTNTGFAGLVGVNTLGISGAATATQRELTYINVYVVVDTSQSMGIAANQTQMTALFAASAPYGPDGPGIGCVFGCHTVSGTLVTMESVAHLNNIQLRIDVARAAIYNMAQAAQSSAVNNNIKFAVYSMQKNPNTGTLLAQVYPLLGLTSNYAALMLAMSPTSYILDLGTNNSGGSGDSDQSNSLALMAATLPTQGDGSSASSPLNYVYVVTDGAIDTPGGGCTYGHCTQAVPSSACDTLKATGATVGVIYTTYIPIYTKNNASLGYDARYQNLVASFAGMISGNLQSCSSGAGWYYQAADDQTLLTAMQSLFASTLSSIRMTN